VSQKIGTSRGQILFEGVSKVFLGRRGEKVQALEDVSFAVPRGSIVSLLGPSGCGKTTILRLAAGMEEPDRGRIGVEAAPGGPGRPALGYLTQRHTLFPWLTVAQNVALPLQLRGNHGKDEEERANRIISSLGLGDFGTLYPYELSGGMQQRAALGRLLSSDAACWLLDEPFAALDERTRHRLQDLLIEINRSRRITVLFVTHSIDEAVYLSDRVHVFSTAPGRIVDTIDLGDSRPRQRLSDAFGEKMERIRRKLEEVIG